jgi:transcriptional regulator with XRE-family HTH domain
MGRHSHDGVGVAIRLAMQASGTSGNALAKALAAKYGTDAPSRTTIGDYIEGRTSPTIATLRMLASVLGVSVLWLISGDDLTDYAAPVDEAPEPPAPSSIVAAWRVPSDRGVDIYEIVRSDGTVWRWRGEFVSEIDGARLPALGWLQMTPPLTESENAEEV